VDVVLDVFVPLLTFVTMAVVGLDLTVRDFRRVAESPRLVVAGTMGQWVLLPVATLALVRLLSPPETVAAGMAVIAACPGGALSNLFTYLARANVALSVTLTAVSSLLATLTLPIVVQWQMGRLFQRDADLDVPVGRMVAQLVAFLLVPIALGMFLRHRWPALSDRHAATFRNSSMVAGLLLVAFVLYDQRTAVAELAGPVLLMAGAYSVVAMAAGVVTGLALRASADDVVTMLIEFACRNLPIATLVGVTLLDRPDFVVFAAAFFLVQTALTSAIVFTWRHGTRRTATS
jgi:BASS family bile acid:Na+ symporter